MEKAERHPAGSLGPTLLAFALLAVGMLVPNTLGALAVFMQPELGFDDAQLGQLLATFWLATAVLAGALGGRADRTGWRPGAFAGCAVIAASLVLLGLSENFAALAVAMLLAAVGYAFCSPTSNLVIVRLVHVRRQAFSFGLKQTAPIVITMAAGLAVPVLASHFGWRSVLVIWAPVLLAPVAFGMWWRHPHDGARAVGREGQRLFAHGGERMLVLLACANGIGTFGMAGASGFAVRSLVEAGVHVAHAGGALAVASGTALAVRVLGGWWLDRASARGSLALVTLVVVGGTGALMMASGVPGLMVLGLVLNVGGAWSWPPLLLMQAVQRFAHAPGSVSGYLQVGASIGAASGPLAFGLVAQRVSFTSAWLMLVASASLGAVAIAWSQRSDPGTASSS